MFISPFVLEFTLKYIGMFCSQAAHNKQKKTNEYDITGLDNSMSAQCISCHGTAYVKKAYVYVKKELIRYVCSQDKRKK